MSPILLDSIGGKKRFFWNVDANVGALSPNKPEDVHLIQFGYSLMSRLPTIDADLRVIYARVRVGVACTGREDDPLIQAIRAHQRKRGGTQDGHVSPIRAGGQYSDSDGPHTFMLTAINNNVFDSAPRVYPRLDLISGCPTLVSAAVLAVFAR